MPLYEYFCKKCRRKFEKVRLFEESDKPFSCPNCKKKTAKIISSFACKTGSYIKGGDQASCNQVYSNENYYVTWKDSFIFFRLSYTCMAVGVSLSSLNFVTPPQPNQLLPIIDLLFLFFSIIFLVAVIIYQFRNSPFSTRVLKLGDGLSLVFLLFSLMFIIANWVKVMQTVFGNPDQNLIRITWIQTIYSRSVLPWLLLFVITFIFYCSNGDSQIKK
jgi:putative FmdB family regulatory protein